MMKSIKIFLVYIRLLAFCCIVPFCVSCKKQIEDSCPPPATENEMYTDNVIDWEDYNNVWTVRVNNNLECSDPRVTQNNGRNIKVYGWLIKKNNEIIITKDSLCALEQMECWGIPIYCVPEIQTAIDTYDLTRKCYLIGELVLEKTMNGEGVWCCQVNVVRINLKSLDNIYFE